jgi:small-conductance mechanosensitive channel
MREMTDLLSNVRWGRVLLASLATHVANVVVAVLLIVVYTLLAVGPQREPSGGITDPLASQVASWPVPILTLFAAAWVARRAEPAAASLHGLLVGFLVATIFAVLSFGPFNVWGLLLFALMIAAGLVGGLIGRADRN